MATISGSSVATLEYALQRVNLKYCGNVEFSRTGSTHQRGGIRQRGGTVLAFRLTVNDSRGPGHRMTARPAYYGGKPRRLRAACWHVWRDFLNEVFQMNSHAVVRTSLATYRGRDGFEREFPETFRRNAGSENDSQPYGTLCVCLEPAIV